MSLPPCDPEVFSHGTHVLTVGQVSAAVMEEWVKLVAAESGQRVDWSYCAGRAVVQCLGDAEAVRVTALRLKQKLFAAGGDDPWTGVFGFNLVGDAEGSSPPSGT